MIFVCLNGWGNWKTKIKKYGPFAECNDKRGWTVHCSGPCLLSAMAKPLGKHGTFAECWPRHSANEWCRAPPLTHLPSVKRDTQQMAVNGTLRFPLMFAECPSWHSANGLPSARGKTLGKGAFAVIFYTVWGLPSVTLGKTFAECLTLEEKGVLVPDAKPI